MYYEGIGKVFEHESLSPEAKQICLKLFIKI